MKNIFLVLASILIFSLFLELALRLYPNKFYDKYKYYRENDTIGKIDTLQHVQDETRGFAYAPSQTASRQSSCYNNEYIAINSRGFRDKEWPLVPLSGSVAAFGDSMIVGREVSEKQVVTSVLGELLGARVFNLGVNSYAPKNALKTYEVFVDSLRPKVVLFFAYLGNDVIQNFCPFSNASDNGCGSVDQNDEIVFSQLRPKEKAATVRPTGYLWKAGKALGNVSVLVYVAYEAKKALASLRRTIGLFRSHIEIMNTAESEEWSAAWSVFGEVIKKFRYSVEERGQRFVLVLVPDNKIYDTNLRSALLSLSGVWGIPHLDTKFPSKRAESLAKKLRVDYINLADAFGKYQNRHQLAAPYFSYRCDGHWNPLGHFIAAQAIADLLVEKGYVEPPVPPNAQHSSLFKKSPKEILGNEAFSEIYESGMYSPLLN